MKTKNFHQKE